MKTVRLTTKEFQTIPGYSTKLTVGHWKGKIDGLLYDLGKNKKTKLKRKAWLTEDNREILMLEIDFTIGNVTQTIAFQLEPVMITREQRVGSKINSVPEEAASWRLFYELLEDRKSVV